MASRTIGESRDDFRQAEVIRAARITPNMIRVRLGADGLEGLRRCRHGDERIRIGFPAQAHGAPPEVTLHNGMWGYHDQQSRDRVRSYSVRRWSPAGDYMDVDFVVHDAGVAASWACSAAPGDRVTVSASDGWYDPPADASWQLLIADMTGLPALERIVEELPGHVETHVVVEVISEGDAPTFEPERLTSVRCFHHTGHGLAPSALADAVQAFEPPDSPGYVWFAGEAAASRQVRRQVRTQWQMRPTHFDIIGYWTMDKEHWRRRYREVEAELQAFRRAAVERGVTGSELLSLYDDELERRGL